jgi:hypothetical protein
MTFLLAEPGGHQDLRPGDLRDVLSELGEPGGVRVNEVVVEHCPGRGGLGLQQQRVDGLEQREIATGPDVQELVGDGRSAADDSAYFLRVLEPDQPGLGQRVDRNDLSAVALGLLER